jgi:hypothetical protein
MASRYDDPTWGRGVLDQYGLGNFLAGGAYGPERIQALFRQGYGGNLESGPSAGAMQQYGALFGNMAGRSAAIQAGHAASGMEGMSPAAQAAAMARISQMAGAQAAEGSLQGLSQGGGWLQQALMQSRGLQSNLFSSALQNALSAGNMGVQLSADERQRLFQEEEAKKQRRAGLLGALAGGLGSLLGGGALGALGGLLGLGGGQDKYLGQAASSYRYTPWQGAGYPQPVNDDWSYYG